MAERSYKGRVPVQLRFLNRLDWKVQENLYKAKRLHDEVTGSKSSAAKYQRAIENFKHYLDQLYMNYEHKFEYRESVEVPEDIGEELEEKEVKDLDFDDAKRLYKRIRKLREELNHTRVEAQEREEKVL